jgi:hypothetical protein
MLGLAVLGKDLNKNIQENLSQPANLTQEKLQFILFHY